MHRKAAGFLVFPSVIKAGIGLGGEYGEGVLIIKGNPAGYYNLLSASFLPPSLGPEVVTARPSNLLWATMLLAFNVASKLASF